MVVCFSAQFCSHRRTDETEHTAACQSAEGHQRPEMCIRHFTSQALRLTWSRSTHPPLTCHPSTHLSPLYAASPPSLPPSLTLRSLSACWGMLSSSRASLCSTAKGWNLRKSRFVSQGSSCSGLNGP